MSFPSPAEIKNIASDYGYVERRNEVSSTLFFKERYPVQPDCPILINVFYTTRGIMTKLPHPSNGYNQLWRSSAYDSIDSLCTLFENPRTHTGKGYRQAQDAVRGCCDCGDQKKRTEFSKNQWRKGPGQSKCLVCVQGGETNHETATTQPNQIGEVSPECIQCDAEGCSNSSPPIRCSNCMMVYYCSRECQGRHAKAHAPECRMGNLIFEMFKADPRPEPSEHHRRGIGMVAMLAGRRDFEGSLRIADYHEIEGNWDAAIEYYWSVFDEAYTQPPPKMRQIMMGLTRCFYEVQRYEHAISLGDGAIEMNRHFPQVHKYVALSQKALGDKKGAIATAKQAVLYETPWDEENIQKNLAFLQEIEADCK